MLKFNQFIAEKKMAAPKIDANRGDLAEIILGAAVAAKFKYPPLSGLTTITRKQVEEILLLVTKAASKKTMMQRADKQKGTVKVDDNIEFRVGVPAKAWTFISNKSNWKMVDELFLSSEKYVNTDRRLRGQVNKVYINGKKDFVLVNADGTGDQKGTKADIKLSINGKETVNQISLKVKGGEQFAQVAGVTFEKQTTIWGKLGIDVSSAKTNYDKYFQLVDFETRFKDRGAINKTDIGLNLRLAAAEAYKIGAKKLEAGLSKSDPKMIHALTMFVKQGAIKDDPNIELVKLVGGTFKRAKFGKQFEENMKMIAPTLKVEYTRKTDPIVKIFDPDRGSGAKGLLIQIRGKYTAESSGSGDRKVYKPYFRNIVEAGDLFFELATDR